MEAPSEAWGVHSSGAWIFINGRSLNPAKKRLYRPEGPIDPFFWDLYL
jgi:hypothetical protein